MDLVTIEVWIHRMGCQRISFYSETVEAVHIKKKGKPILEGTYDLFEKALTGADILNDISDEKLLEELSRRVLNS